MRIWIIKFIRYELLYNGNSYNIVKLFEKEQTWNIFGFYQ